jgi:hypothetical protein
VSKFSVCGHNILDEDEVLPVLIRCAVCGSMALIGEHDYAVDITKLTDWAAAHKCPREMRVT